jgi:hypothetical protein
MTMLVLVADHPRYHSGKRPAATHEWPGSPIRLIVVRAARRPHGVASKAGCAPVI